MSTKDVLYILPKELRAKLESIKSVDKLQEIRIKINKKLIVYVGNIEIIVDYLVKKEDIKVILQRISNYSIYAFEEEIKQGYITIKGGHRVGICGSCVIENEKVKTIKNIASLNIRICREVIGCSNNIMPYILNNSRVFNTIIISPPKCGKTTLIRDISRNLSDAKKKICIVDERSEIGACFEGVPQMNIGLRTDVFDNCVKSEGIIMAIRSMAPEVIVCDEIGTYKDMESIIMAMNSGVNLITTIHGFGIEDLYRRPVFKEILENKVFQRAVVLSSINGVGTVEYIYDFNKKGKLWGE
ncbi:stage III sporulation protein AA [Clostridium botulinum]|uniref:stage III sporulation protein AA n=1 Tax=Clostridium botulinum TaxID=1491 RepID=UPI0004D46822|nr:stage III sporulation protein AA [Clostridium botulinum]KEI07108.1 stage III sporulation protein AA [Clostridium botulinum C/D str. BKT75002]KEI12185.1 stage III sporulation protein AA [Clostridium botulinum C/D str. BKT2873]